jgi:hypothetical protein
LVLKSVIYLLYQNETTTKKTNIMENKKNYPITFRLTVFPKDADKRDLFLSASLGNTVSLNVIG